MSKEHQNVILFSKQLTIDIDTNYDIIKRIEKQKLKKLDQILTFKLFLEQKFFGSFLAFLMFNISKICSKTPKIKKKCLPVNVHCYDGI